MAKESSDSDFDPPPSIRRRTASSRILSLSRGLCQSYAESTSVRQSSHSGPSTSSSSNIAVTARRLNHVLIKARIICCEHSMICKRLCWWRISQQFPFLSQPANGARYLTGTSRARANPRKWKTTPCLLNSPSMTRVPTREVMDNLCRKGMV